MTCHDWRTCSPEEGTALVTSEIDAWLTDLAWDVRDSWRVVEPARRAGHVPGFVVRDDEQRAVGWAACSQIGSTWHVFVLAAADAGAVELLLDAIERAADHAGAGGLVVCVRDAAPGLSASLQERGFQVDRYRYLSKSLASASRSDLVGLPWRTGQDEAAMARLCARAYRNAPGVRAFAVEDTPEAWADYIQGLVATTGCGRFAPDLSGAIDDGTARLAAAIMVTHLGPGTIHIAQLAVDPDARGRRLGGRLLEQAEVLGARHGAHDITLLVSAANGPAVRLYESREYEDRAAFVVATRQPSLSTSLALATGGANTRR